MQMAKTVNYVFLGLGSNLGNKAQNLQKAIKHLEANTNIFHIEQSSIYENKAIEEAGPDDFLNQVIFIETSLSAYELLTTIQNIEQELDPQRESRGRKKSRYLDIDILIFNDDNIDDKLLTIPHPRMQERDFVMNPLNELKTKKLQKQILLKPQNNNKAIKSLMDFNDFTRKLSKKELKLLDKIEDFKKQKNQFVFRPMLLEDLDIVLELDEIAFGKKHWGRDTFVKELNNQYANYITVTTLEKEVIAYIGTWYVIDEMHIMTLAVAQKAQRQGIAEALLMLAFQHAYKNKIRTATLEVKANNFAAISLYKKYLFKQQGIRPKYYSDGQDALLLWTNEISEDLFIENFCKQIENAQEKLVV